MNMFNHLLSMETFLLVLSLSLLPQFVLAGPRTVGGVGGGCTVKSEGRLQLADVVGLLKVGENADSREILEADEDQGKDGLTKISTSKLKSWIFARDAIIEFWISLEHRLSNSELEKGLDPKALVPSLLRGALYRLDVHLASPSAKPQNPCPNGQIPAAIFEDSKGLTLLPAFFDLDFNQQVTFWIHEAARFVQLERNSEDPIDNGWVMGVTRFLMMNEPSDALRKELESRFAWSDRGLLFLRKPIQWLHSNKVRLCDEIQKKWSEVFSQLESFCHQDYEKGDEQVLWEALRKNSPDLSNVEASSLKPTDPLPEEFQQVLIVSEADIYQNRAGKIWQTILSLDPRSGLSWEIHQGHEEGLPSTFLLH